MPFLKTLATPVIHPYGGSTTGLCVKNVQRHQTNLRCSRITNTIEIFDVTHRSVKDFFINAHDDPFSPFEVRSDPTTF